MSADENSIDLVSLRGCEEDIDMLSELIDSNSNESDSYELPGIETGEIDELTNYLYSSRRSDGKLEPSVSLSRCDPLLPQVMTSGCRRPSHSQGNRNLPQSKTDIQIPVVTSGGYEASKSVVMVVPTANNQYSTMPCMTRNAVAARENRQKKKSYFQQLEKDCQDLRNDNHSLKEKLAVQEDSVAKLGVQVEYLQGVIANQSALSALLTNIKSIAGIKLKSSWSNLSKSDDAGLSKKCLQNNLAENEENETDFLRRSKRKCVFEPENTDQNLSSKKGKHIRRKDDDSHRGSISKCNVLPIPEPVQIESVSNRKEAGICLHVNGSQVSLEFCSACSDMAASSQVLDDHCYVRSKTDL